MTWHAIQHLSSRQSLQYAILSFAFCFQILNTQFVYCQTLDSPKITFRNNTSTTISVTVHSVELADTTSHEVGVGLILEAGKSDEAYLPSLDDLPQAVRYTLTTKLGRVSFESKWKTGVSGARSVDLGPSDLPVVHKQKSKHKWLVSGRGPVAGKYVNRIYENGVTLVEILNEDDVLEKVKYSSLDPKDHQFIDGIEDGSNSIMWDIGSPKIKTEHLVGRNVKIVMVRKFAIDASGRRLDPDWVYGPILEGKIVEEKGALLAFKGTAKVFQLKLLHEGFKEIASQQAVLSLKNDGIRSRETERGDYNYSQWAIDSIVVDGLIYSKVNKSSILKLGPTAFWKDIEAGKTPRFITKADEQYAKEIRMVAGGFAAIGAVVLGMKQLQSSLDIPDSDPPCDIEGKAPPNTVIHFGPKFANWDSTKSDRYGNYRISYLFLKPAADQTYYLRIEVNGKKEQVWEGRINPAGANRIDIP